MKFRSFIWISGIALVLLIPVQYYITSETFQTKKQQFDSKYNGLARLGVFEFESRYYDAIQDSIFGLLDEYSFFAMHDLGFSGSPLQEDSIIREIIAEFEKQLNIDSERDEFLVEYINKTTEPAKFYTKAVIQQLELLTPTGPVNIISNFVETEILANPESFLVNNYVIERNYFRIIYDYHISFPERTDRIRKEMQFTISLSVITLFIVAGVFFLTLRNLLIQKRLSEMKTDFINNMTHELKTPLSTISVASSSLVKNTGEMDPKRIMEVSGIIKKQNRHLTNLIDKILDISIWEKDQVKLNKQPTRLLDFLINIIEDFQRTHPEALMDKGFGNITEEYEANIDRIHMTTVINNLLSNAYKYGGTPPSISINAEMEEHLKISVSDNGQGIRDDEMSQVFEKFFRGRNTKKQAIRGLGLGLYYVKQIVEAHKGTIIAYSNKGKGTTFTFEIPG